MFQVAHFKEYIPQAFPGGHSMILDAEVLLIDTKTSKPLPFGTLGVHKVRTLQPLYALCFVTQLFSCLPLGFLVTPQTFLSSPFRKQPFKTPRCAFLFSTAFTSMVWVSWRGNALSIHPLSQKWLCTSLCRVTPYGDDASMSFLTLIGCSVLVVCSLAVMWLICGFMVRFHFICSLFFLMKENNNLLSVLELLCLEQGTLKWLMKDTEDQSSASSDLQIHIHLSKSSSCNRVSEDP